MRHTHYFSGRIILVLLFLQLFTFAQCKKNENPSPVPTVENDYSLPLKDVAAYPVGAAIKIKTITNAKSLEILGNEFSSVTCENDMKIKATQPTADGFKFDDADAIVNYAVGKGKRVHGHTLIWGNSLPDWVTNFSGDSTAWENLMKTRIQTMVTHFKGRVKSWDVVNEALNDDGTIKKFANSSGYKENLWCQKLGPDYIARAFQYARQADPDVLLFYNDYGHEYSPSRNHAIVAMVADFKKRGIPIDGIGLQMHIGIWRSNEDLRNAIQTMASTGLLIHISELNISINQSGNLTQPTTTLLNEQKAKYKAVAQYLKLIPAKQQYGITLWAFGDADSYKTNDWPLPWDKSYEKKPAYYGLWEGVKATDASN